MKKTAPEFFAILPLLLICQCSYTQKTIKEISASEYIPIDKEIYDIIVTKDKEYFDAYNSCNMKKQESLYAESIEFFS